MADQYWRNVSGMFTFHMQIRSAANTLSLQPANIQRICGEHDSKQQIKYAANIPQTFCEYATNMHLNM